MAIARRGANAATFTATRSPVLTLPAGVVSGDVILAVVAGNSAQTFTVPTGWTQIDAYSVAATGAGILIFRQADGTEGTSYTLTNILGTAATGECAAVVYSGCDANVPALISTTGNTNHLSAVTSWGGAAGDGLPLEIPETGMAVVIIGGGFGALTGGTTGTPDTGFTEVIDAINASAGYCYIEEQLAITAGAYDADGRPSGGSFSSALPQAIMKPLTLIPAVANVQRRRAGTAADDATVGTVAWSGTIDLATDNPILDTYAQAASVPTTASHYLKLTNFGFSLPAGAVPAGVQAFGVVSDNGSRLLVDNSVKLVKTGVIGGTEKARLSTSPWGTYFNADIAAWGGTSDLWGLTLTQADVEASTFGLAISGKATSTTSTANINSAVLSVTYTVVAPSNTVAPKLTPTANQWLADPSFETGVSEWSVPVGDTMVQDSSTAKFGTHSLKWTTTGISGQTKGPFLAPASSGQTWTGSVYVKVASSIGTFRVSVLGTDNSGAFQEFGHTDVVLTGGGDWQRISATVTFASAGTTRARLAFDQFITGATSIWLDGAQLEQAASASTFVDGTSKTVGTQFISSTGTWTGAVSFAYQWQRDAHGNLSYSNIASATTSTYTLVDADDGCNVRCNVIATNTGGNTTAPSNVVGLVVEPAPTNSVAPVASGVASTASVLSVTNGTWTNMSGFNPTFTYAWQRSNDGATGWTNISSATSSTYTVATGDLRFYLRCEVSAHNTGST